RGASTGTDGSIGAEVSGAKAIGASPGSFATGEPAGAGGRGVEPFASASSAVGAASRGEVAGASTAGAGTPAGDADSASGGASGDSGGRPGRACAAALGGAEAYPTAGSA